MSQKYCGCNSFCYFYLSNSFKICRNIVIDFFSWDVTGFISFETSKVRLTHCSQFEAVSFVSNYSTLSTKNRTKVVSHRFQFSVGIRNEPIWMKKTSHEVNFEKKTWRVIQFSFCFMTPSIVWGRHDEPTSVNSKNDIWPTTNAAF